MSLRSQLSAWSGGMQSSIGIVTPLEFSGNRIVFFMQIILGWGSYRYKKGLKINHKFSNSLWNLNGNVNLPLYFGDRHQKLALGRVLHCLIWSKMLWLWIRPVWFCLTMISKILWPSFLFAFFSLLNFLSRMCCSLTVMFKNELN